MTTVFFYFLPFLSSVSTAASHLILLLELLRCRHHNPHHFPYPSQTHKNQQGSCWLLTQFCPTVPVTYWSATGISTNSRLKSFDLDYQNHLGFLWSTVDLNDPPRQSKAKPDWNNPCVGKAKWTNNRVLVLEIMLVKVIHYVDTWIKLSDQIKQGV